MKKIFFFGSFILLMAGCSNSNTNQSESVTKNTTNTQQSTSSLVNSSETTGKTATSESQPKQADALTQLLQTYPDTLLPTTIPVEQNLNIAATETKQGFSVLYYDLNRKLPLNDQQLNHETAKATYLYRYGFASSDEAVTAMQPFTVDTNAQKVDLGHALIGYQQGAAGSSYLEWTEGNWRLRVRASNINGQNPVPAAKEIVEFLEKNTLPAPEIVGTISVELNDTSNKAAQVSWQTGTNLYTVTHQNTLSALAMAVSMNRE